MKEYINFLVSAAVFSIGAFIIFPSADIIDVVTFSFVAYLVAKSFL